MKDIFLLLSYVYSSTSHSDIKFVGYSKVIVSQALRWEMENFIIYKWVLGLIKGELNSKFDDFEIYLQSQAVTPTTKGHHFEGENLDVPPMNLFVFEKDRFLDWISNWHNLRRLSAAKIFYLFMTMKCFLLAKKWTYV